MSSEISSISEGRARIDAVNEAISAVVENMLIPIDAEHLHRLDLRKQVLIKERREVQSQMTKLFRGRHQNV